MAVTTSTFDNMDTVTLHGNYALAGQGLSFEGSWIQARFKFGDIPMPDVFASPSTYDWTIGTRSVQTPGWQYAAAYSEYETAQRDVGQAISVTANVPYLGVMHTATSTRPLQVLNVNDLPVGTLRIEGDTRSAGSLLTAVSTISDEDGMGALSYQWQADGQAIAGATGATYTLGQLEAGKNISVVASYVDGFGQRESVASNADPNLVHLNTTGSSSVTGLLAAGQTLHVDVVDPDHSGKIYYQWQAGDSSGNYLDIDGAWSSDFTLGAAPPAAVRVLTTYADRYGVVEAQAHTIGTEGNDVLKGDANVETIMARGGDDIIHGVGRGDRIDGGAGLDTFVTFHSRYLFSQTRGVPGQWEVADIIFAGDPYLLTNIERVHFANGGDGVALDYDGHAGQAYRLYQAAFDRTPDKIGQGFWMNRLDVGVSLGAIADAFVASSEFRQLYGEHPSNAEIVNKFYQNVLHRAPDPSSQFWIDVLDSKRATVAEVLIGFSESAENVAALVGVSDRGIDFTPYQGT
jgi:hypothetical protein